MAEFTCIRIKAVDQRLAVVLQPLLASGDVGTVRVEYELDSSWSGYAPSGTFYSHRHPENVYEQVLTDGACVIPWEVLQEEGLLYIGLRGVDGDGRVKTAASCRYRVEKGSPRGNGTTPAPTPDIYAQILDLLNRAGLKPSTRVDLSRFSLDGVIVETYADGSTKTTTMEFDGNGNPVKITDSLGNETVLSW